MDIQETVLCMQLGKCFFNFMPFLFLRETRSQSSITSLLILVMTDTLITGFLLCSWFGGWLLSPSTDVVFLRFLFFQNETYRSTPLLIPCICLCEELSRSSMNKLGATSKGETPLAVQSRLLSLTCWLIAALRGKHVIPEYLDIQPECDDGEWESIYIYINASRNFDWLLLSIGLVLGTTLFHSIKESKDQARTINTWFKEKRTFKGLMIPLLLTAVTIVLFYFLPPFIAVCSWSILALDSVCGLLRCNNSQPASTVYSALEDVQVKDTETIMETNH